VAEVSKRWFRVRDTYGIEVAPAQDDALILAVTVCIDRADARLSAKSDFRRRPPAVTGRAADAL